MKRRVKRVLSAETVTEAMGPAVSGLGRRHELQRRRRTMIAESPMASCDNTATLYRQRQMASARARVRLCARASVTGVAFFDFYHGQTGVAPERDRAPPDPCVPMPDSAQHTSASEGKVKLVSLTAQVRAGSDASLTVAVPTGTSCSIVVTYKSGPSSAAGLYAQRASGGRASWTWRVGARTTPGR